MRLCRYGLVAGVSLVAHGCNTSGELSSGVVVWDSAGVRVVENDAPASEIDDFWTLADTPSVRIGVVDGPHEYEFSSVVAALRLGDGRILVADESTREVRFFDVSGRFLYSFGGQGSGPGEFRTLTTLIRYRGDSIAVWDGGSLRLSVFDRGGRLERTQRFPLPTATPQGSAGGISITSPGRIVGAFPDGALLIVPGINVGGEAGEVVEFDRELVLLSAVGRPVRSLGRFPGYRVMVPDLRALAEGRPHQLPIPYERPFLVAVHADRIFLGPDERFSVQVRSKEGALEQIVRRSGPPVELRPFHQEGFRDDQRRRLREGGFGADATITPAGLDEALDGVWFPEVLPPYSGLVVDSVGRLWVEHFRAPGAGGPNTWSVFDLDGRLLGEVEMPAHLEVVEIGEDYVLGTSRDEMGVPYVEMFLFVPG